MIHPPVKTRVVGSRVKAETKNPGHTTRDNHRASSTLVVQIQRDLTGALSPSGVRHTYKLPFYYTHSSCKGADDSVQRQLYKGRKTLVKWGSHEPEPLLVKHRRAGGCHTGVIPKMAQSL